MIAADPAPPEAAGDEPPRPRWDIHVPMSTILKLLASGLGVWAVWVLWPWFLLFLISVLLAVTLHPAVLWMERRGLGRKVSVGIITAVGLGATVIFFALILPPLTLQMASLVRDLPEFRDRILSRIPTQYPALQSVVRALYQAPVSPRSTTILEQSYLWGQTAVSGLASAAVVIVLTLYLIIDGRSLYAWVLAFVPRTQREKLATTTDEMSEVVQAFVSGQLIAAVLFGIFTAALLTILGVPAAAPLAVIAAVCDIIPVLGILLATLPAALLAFTVSPGTAMGVLAGYLGDHVFETYLLLPRIYGTKLKISTLAVLLALIVGGRLQGIIGAILVLPLVAAYPIIERHWLAGKLRARVLTDHRALASAAAAGSDTAIDTVLSGEKHASEDKRGPGDSALE